MSGISHFTPRSRAGRSEHRFVLAGPWDASYVHHCYRTMRLAGIPPYAARGIVIDLLRAGQFATLVDHAGATS